MATVLDRSDTTLIFYNRRPALHFSKEV